MRAWLLLLSLIGSIAGAAPAKVDPTYPFRTDLANEHLPWYRLKPGEFPPLHSEHVVDGVLLEVDFIHRSGQFRRSDDGTLVDFTMPSFGTVMYLNAEADLRDVPLGIVLHFSTYQDEQGTFTRVAAIRDDDTTLVADGLTLPLDKIAAGEGKLATDQQRARHRAFLKERGLPAWIDRVEGKKLTVTLFGNPASLRALLKDEGIDPARWAAERRSVDAVVANEELRTYNPPVDRQRSKVLEYTSVPGEGQGCGGVRWIIEPRLLLEGFRKGRVIRLFAHPSWPVNDMPFGEGLYSEEPDAKPDSVDPNLYPYRTDSGNDHLPWYRPKPGEFPPFHSHHLIGGELAKVDPHGRSGQFRADRSGERVDFTMAPFGTVMYLNAEADLRDVPLGTRCRFFLHQDDRGEFTSASVISDDFSRLASDGLTYRLEATRLDEGMIRVAKQHAPVKNEKGDRIRPPDFGREDFAVADRTRVWKGDKRATLRDLAVGDELLVNRIGRTATSRGLCTDIWIGSETHKLASNRQRAKHDALLKDRGLPAWIDSVEGKRLTITFFSGSRRDFPSLLNGHPGGESVFALLADEELRPTDEAVIEFAYLDHPPEGDTAATYGCSGVRWLIEASELPDGFRPGRVLRIFKQGWPIQPNAKGDPLPK